MEKWLVVCFVLVVCLIVTAVLMHSAVKVDNQGEKEEKVGLDLLEGMNESLSSSRPIRFSKIEVLLTPGTMTKRMRPTLFGVSNACSTTELQHQLLVRERSILRQLEASSVKKAYFSPWYPEPKYNSSTSSAFGLYMEVWY